MTEIADRVREIIFEHFKARQIDPAQMVAGARLVEDLGADSLDLVDIVLALEDQFGREISETEVEKAATVADLIALVESLARPKSISSGFPAPPNPLGNSEPAQKEKASKPRRRTTEPTTASNNVGAKNA